MTRNSILAVCAAFAMAAGAFCDVSPAARAEEPAAVLQPGTTADKARPLELPTGGAGGPSSPTEHLSTEVDPLTGITDPIITSVRRKLADPTLEKKADSGDRAALVSFYAERSGLPLWVTATRLTPKATSAIDEIRRADDWGLSAAAFDVPQLTEGQLDPDALADAEIKLGLAVLKYARYARGGRVDPSRLSPLLDQKPNLGNPKTVLTGIATAEAPDQFLQSLHPKHEQFVRLRQALLKLRAGGSRENAPSDAARITLPAGRNLRPGAKHADVALLRRRLSVSAEQGKEDVYDAALQGAVKVFQKERGLEPSGIVTSRTRAALNGESPASKSTNEQDIQRLLINMERWRWMPEDLGALYVWDNVPEFKTRVVKGGKTIHSDKIIVGLPEWATPVFSADMQLIVFQPEWGVPDGIKMKELLPKLRRTSGNFFDFFGDGGNSGTQVLRAYGLQASLNGRPIDPDSVNWSAVDIRRFSFTQPPGGKNPLGDVKFRFPNKHDVYMHDTTQRELFARPRPALSHGCMRVQDARRFAEVLLAEDKGWSPTKVGSLLATSYNNEVKLDHPIPVHVTYFTVVVDDDGKVETFGDLYGHDSRVATALLGKPVRFEVPQEDPDLTVARRDAQRKQASPSGPADLADVISGLFAN